MAITKIPPEEWARIQKLVARSRQRQEDARPPAIYAYRRCSHADSAFSRYGLDDQRDDLERFIAKLQDEEQFAGHINGGIFTDEATSGAKIPFCARRQGQLLNARLRPGDVVVFPKIDRASRKVADFAPLLEQWAIRGITAMFAQENVAYTRDGDNLIINVLASVAERTSYEASVAAKRVAKRQRAINGQSGGTARYGFKWTGPRGKRRLIPDREQRQIGQQLVRIVVKHQNWTWDQVSDELYKKIAASRGLPPNKSRAYRKEWTKGACFTRYRKELALQEEERVQREKRKKA